MRTTKNIAEDLYASYLELAQIVDPIKAQEYPKPSVDINKLARMVEQFDKRLSVLEEKLEAKKDNEPRFPSEIWSGLGAERCSSTFPYTKYQCVLAKDHESKHITCDGHEWEYRAGEAVVDSKPSRPAWIREDGSVDWEKVPVDTKMLTKDIEGTWAKGYFAYYEEGAVYWFKNGATSWSEEKCTWTCDRNAKLA